MSNSNNEIVILVNGINLDLINSENSSTATQVTIDNINVEFKSRGFCLVSYLYNELNKCYTIVLKLSRILETKIHLQLHNLSRTDDDQSCSLKMSEISIRIIKRMPFIQVLGDRVDIWIAHSDFESSITLRPSKNLYLNEKEEVASQLDKFCSYYGAEPAVCVGFFESYSKSLQILSFLELILCFQMMFRNYYSFIITNCFIICTWHSVYIENWELRFNQLKHHWRKNFVLNSVKDILLGKTVSEV